MKNLLVVIVLATMLPACTAGAAAAAASGRVPGEQIATALRPYLRKTVQFDFPSIQKTFPVHVYFGEPSSGTENGDVILYLKNRAWERVGQEDDLSILKDYLSRKFIVLTLDFGDEPRASSPFIDEDLATVWRSVFGARGVRNILKDIPLETKGTRCFFLPEGYRVATNLTYWEIDKHGVYGTLEFIMKTFNEEVIPEYRKEHPKAPPLKPVSKPSELVDLQGKPFDYRIQMDIVYPSQPMRRLPTYVYSETQIPRSTEPWNQFQLRGYVHVMMGHCFNPCVLHYTGINNFTLDHWNGLACYTAGIRYLYKNADRYGIDTNHIGMLGISKGQYAVTRLSDPHHADSTESLTFNQTPKGLGKFPPGTPEPQPWLGYPSRIHCGWQGMGMGLWENVYITRDYVPTILACGDHDREPVVKEGTPLFVKTLEKLDVNHVFLPQDNLGHSISLGYDERLGVDRYRLVADFFDRYLKPEAKLPPVVLIAWPKDGAEEVSPTVEIRVQFAPVIAPRTVLVDKAIWVQKLGVDEGAGDEVQGTWKVSHGGTMFTLVPEKPLEKGAMYRIAVTRGVKDKAGTPVRAVRKFRFTVAN